MVPPVSYGACAPPNVTCDRFGKTPPGRSPRSNEIRGCVQQMKHKLLLLSLFGLLIGASIYYKSYLLYDHAYHSSFIRLRISGGPLKIINSGRLYMAIGSAPGNVERRLSLRNSWIKWIEERNDSYYFYTEFPHCQSSDVKCKILQESLIMENEKWKDLVFLNSSSIGRSDYALRGIETLRHAVSTSEARYFLKIDDDGFLCLPKISEELKWFPKHLFLWAKYWFRKGNKIHYTGGRVRPDENFLLMSRDIVEFIAKNYKILTVDYDLTFSANLAFWTHFLNLTIFDDRGRIDSQQHYLTKYMVSILVFMICDSLISCFCSTRRTAIITDLFMQSFAFITFMLTMFPLKL